MTREQKAVMLHAKFGPLQFRSIFIGSKIQVA